jgi:hypothetical protein
MTKTVSRVPFIASPLFTPSGPTSFVLASDEYPDQMAEDRAQRIRIGEERDSAFYMLMLARLPDGPFRAGWKDGFNDGESGYPSGSYAHSAEFTSGYSQGYSFGASFRARRIAGYP